MERHANGAGRPIIATLILALVLLAVVLAWMQSTPTAPIRVGVLHSLSGTMALSERAVVDATVLALEEINAEGGLLGRPLEILVVDGESDNQRFAREAERLIDEEAVSVVFGCWTSACRKSVLPIFESRDHLLVYPLQYEGMETSPNILYTGATPNQQVIPALKWGLDHIGRRILLVGSDYIFPRSANRIVKDYAELLGAELLGEYYLPLGSAEVGPVVVAIGESRPDLIINTLNGDSNLHFFRALREAGIGPGEIPSISFSIGENELMAMEGIDMRGEYAAWSYFESLEGEDNQAFKHRFRARYGEDRRINDPMQAAYVGVKLWAQAVKRSGHDAPIVVNKALLQQSYAAPEGLVSVEAVNRHLWKPARIARVNDGLDFDVVWDSQVAIRPTPYLSYRKRSEWEDFQQALFEAWGGRWSAPPARGREVE